MDKGIRPIYEELKGYLSEAPKEGYINQSSVWTQVNHVIDELNEIVEIPTEYDRFKFQPPHNQIHSTEFRTRLAGLINRLHGKYFKHGVSPLIENSSIKTNIEVHQQQNQSVIVQMILDVQSLIDNKLNTEIGKEERSFLEKIKGSLSSVGNVMDLIKLILSTGTSLGLTLNQVFELLK